MGTGLQFQTTEKAQAGAAVVSALSTNSWTISFWAKRAVANVHSEYLNLGTAGSLYYNYLGNMYWSIGNGDFGGSTPMVANTFYLWTMVRDGSTFTMYKNGVYVTSGTNTATYTPTAIYFGGYGTNYANTRTLDDVRVYNRALIPTEITQLYNNGEGTEAE